MDLIIDTSLMVGVIMGFTEVIKRLFSLTDESGKKYVPFIALVACVALSFWQNGLNVDSTVLGVVMGLTASGLWSGAKTVSGN